MGRFGLGVELLTSYSRTSSQAELSTLVLFFKMIVQVDHAVWRFMDCLDRNHKKVLGTLMITAILHLVFSVMLIFGSFLYRRSLLIPWMIFHMFSIILMVITFTCWTFFTFFISLLLAIVFPVVAGLLLGLWIVMWREVYHFFISIMDSDTKLLGNINMQMQYKPVE